MTSSKEAKGAEEGAESENAGYYDVLLQKRPSPEVVSAAEPADPERVDHTARRQTRLAPPSFDVNRLPWVFVECGCGECSPAVDPLAGESEVWRDKLRAVDVCDSPLPLTVERAAEVYLRYQKAAYNRGQSCGFKRTKKQHGCLMGAERDVLKKYEQPSVIFLSLRLSPIEDVEGVRRWVEPIRLDNRLHDSWSNVYGTMNYQLRDFDYEFIRVTTGTRSAATPHMHVQILVDDPENAVTVGMAQSMVDSYVRNTKGAYSEDHPVEKGESDAGLVFHDPPRVDYDDERDLQLLKARDGDGFPMNTVTTKYMANQRPHWVLGNVYDGESDVNADSVLVDGAAISWAVTNDWLGSSNGIDLGGEIA